MVHVDMRYVNLYNIEAAGMLIKIGDARRRIGRLACASDASRIMRLEGWGAMMEVTQMLYLKACPRCKGDMHTNRDVYGAYSECLQCGYMVDIERPNSPLSVPLPRTNRKAA